jgi:hypothetical protein
LRSTKRSALGEEGSLQFMSLATMELTELLEGIKNHARAGNFDLVSIQSRYLVVKMEEAIQANAEDSSRFRQALPAVRALILDGTRSDPSSANLHVNEAKNALGITPGVTPAWPTPPGATEGRPDKPYSPRSHDVQRPVNPAEASVLSQGIHEVIDIKTASEQDLRRTVGVDESALQQILENRPYQDWQDFSDKNPGFSRPRLESFKQAGVCISPIDLRYPDNYD